VRCFKGTLRQVLERERTYLFIYELQIFGKIIISKIIKIVCCGASLDIDPPPVSYNSVKSYQWTLMNMINFTMLMVFFYSSYRVDHEDSSS